MDRILEAPPKGNNATHLNSSMKTMPIKLYQQQIVTTLINVGFSAGLLSWRALIFQLVAPNTPGVSHLSSRTRQKSRNSRKQLIIYLVRLHPEERTEKT